MAVQFANRGELFRESFEYIERMGEDTPSFENIYGSVNLAAAVGDTDMLPKPTGRKLPLLITGGSQQSPDWLAQNGDGWMIYPRAHQVQSRIIGDWRARIAAKGSPDRPVMEPLYIDLVEDSEAPPQPIHLGLRLGINHLRSYLQSRQDIGVNHVALNLRFNQSDIETTLQQLAEDILPTFSG